MPKKSILHDINDAVYPVTTIDSVYDINNGESLDSVISKKQDKCISKIITINPDDWENNEYTFTLDSINKDSTIFWEIVKDKNYNIIKACKIACDDTQEQNGSINFTCARTPNNTVHIKIAVFN